MVVFLLALALAVVVVYVLWASSDVVRDAETVVPYVFMVAAATLVVATPLAWAIAAL
jgi:hypothetical protein